MNRQPESWNGHPVPLRAMWILHSGALATVVISLLLSSACASRLSPTARVQRPSNDFSAAVQSHMEFLASDAMAGRGSGTRDEWIAATYAAAQMRRFGYEASIACLAARR